MARIKMGEDTSLRVNCLNNRIDDLESCSKEDISYNIDAFSFLKDVARSKKFYLKKKSEESIPDEMTDVFLDRSCNDDTESEEEKILQVVWCEDESVQSKLVKFVEALEIKKSNSKFTLSMFDEDHDEIDMDSLEGEDIKGRFLEAKDSLEIIASTRSIHSSDNKYSDWDFSTEDDQEVNRIWRRNESSWTSSLHIDIGKLPTEEEEEEEMDLTAMDEGTKGKISVLEVAQCLDNVLNGTNTDDENHSKKVSFVNKPSKSLSQTSTQSQKSHKRVCFITECTENTDRSGRKVSFYELPNDDEPDMPLPAEGTKIKKSVSFHDSVEFQKSEKFKDIDGNSCSSEDAQEDLCSASSSSMHCNREKRLVSSNAEDMPKHSRGKSLSSDATSGVSLSDSRSTISTQPSIDESIDFSENQEPSDLSVHSNSGNNDARNLQVINYLSNVTFSHKRANDVDSGVEFVENSKSSEVKSDLENEPLEQKLNNFESIKGNEEYNFEDALAENLETYELIKRTLMHSLDRKLIGCIEDNNLIIGQNNFLNPEEIDNVKKLDDYLIEEIKGNDTNIIEELKSECDFAESLACMSSCSVSNYTDAVDLSTNYDSQDDYETADSEQEI